MMKSQNTTQQEAIEAVKEACRQKGLSITTQRIAIYRELTTTESHPSAEEIYRRLRKSYPTLSLATVYKTLDTLERHHFVTKTRATGEKARYDGNLKPHHHLICRSCGRIKDFYTDSMDPSFLLKRRPQGFKITDYRIDFHGICSHCSPSNKSN